MAKRLFGTDGIRGVANQALSPEIAYLIGINAGRLIAEGDGPKRVLMGRDTRRSGSMIGAAVASGLCAAGVSVTTLAVAPTGAISYIARTGEYDMGIVISASHNPAQDNGIKLLGHDGRKLDDATERLIEELLDVPLDDRPIGPGVGEIVADRTELEGYIEYLETLVPEWLEGMRITMDCAHGAAYALAPQLFRRLGAEVIEIGVDPDGMNINARGGATKPAMLQDMTQIENAHMGIAFDGDADRAVFSDPQGRLINGDRTMALWSAHWRAQGELDPPTIVGTVMSNGGFEAYAKAQGIALERADVGDKYVRQVMDKTGALVGGEQSGHIIFAERGVTGDGLITALEVARVLKREGRTLDAYFDTFQNWPQLLVNVEVERKDGWQENGTLRSVIDQVEAGLEGHGRINVRASGTQPMLRVMVEADNEKLRDESADRVVGTMLEQLGGRIYSRVDLTHALGD